MNKAIYQTFVIYLILHNIVTYITSECVEFLIKQWFNAIFASNFRCNKHLQLFVRGFKKADLQ